MKLNKESRKISRQLFQSAFANGRLDDAQAKLAVKKLIAAKPRHCVGILKAFQRLVWLELERHRVLIESASPLDYSAKNKLVADLQKKYGETLAAEFKINPELIGGLRIKIGNDVWDDTISDRLSRLSNILNQP